LALSGPTITQALLSAGGGVLAGPTFPLVASVLGNALFTWALNQPQNLLLSGITTGGLGPGVVTGTLLVASSPAIIVASLAAVGVVGSTAPLLATAVANGVATAFTVFGQYAGPSIGVALGVDNASVLVANPVTLAPLIAAGLGGPIGPLVALGLANGIAAMLLTGRGVGAVSGVPVPGSGVGISPASVVF
jgi:hypothetical protein